MEEKDIITIIKLNSLTRNVVANFIDEEDKFIKQQTIDHIIRNGKYYNVISISKARVKKIVENGLKYEQLKKENEELKSALAEKDKLLENEIVLKFKIGEILFFVTNIKNKTIKSTNEWCYVLDKEGLFIETNNLPYDNYFYDYKYDRVFATKEEAEEALKKLEEK